MKHSRLASLGLWGLLALFVASSAVLYRKVFGFWFTDVDALSLLATGRFTSLSDLGRIFSSELMLGRMPNAIYYRPLLSVFYGLEWKFFGLSPVGYHAVDIALHGLNAFLVMHLALRLLPSGSGRSLLLSLVAAMFFLLHPLHVENVPAIARQGDLLAVFWVLLTLVLYLTSASSFRRLSLIPFSLALLTKEPTIILAPVLFCGEFLLRDKKFRLSVDRCLSSLRETAPFWILTGVFLLVRFAVLRGSGGYEPEVERTVAAEFLLRARYNIAGHVAGLFLGGFSDGARQTAMGFLKSHVFLAVLFWSGVLGAMVGYIWRRRKEPVVLFLLAVLALHAGMIHLSFFMFRYLYFSLAIFGVLLVWEVNRICEEKRQCPSSIAVLILLGLIVFQAVMPRADLEKRWEESGEIARMTLEQLTDLVDERPDLTQIYLVSIPYQRLFRPRSYFFWDVPQTQILLEHAIQDGLHLRRPDRTIHVHGLSAAYLTSTLTDWKSHATWISPTELEVTVVAGGLAIDYPWVKLPGRVTDESVYEFVASVDPGNNSAKILLRSPHATFARQSDTIFFLGDAGLWQPVAAAKP